MFGIDLQRILVAALRAGGQAFAAVKVAEGDEGVDGIWIEREGALKAFGGVAAPFRIALLARAQKVPGLGVIRLVRDGLFEQDDGAVVIARRAQLLCVCNILPGDGVPYRAPLQVIACAAGRRLLLEKFVVG